MSRLIDDFMPFFALRFSSVCSTSDSFYTMMELSGFPFVLRLRLVCHYVRIDVMKNEGHLFH